MIIHALDQHIDRLLKNEPRSFKNELTTRVAAVAASILAPIEAIGRIAFVPVCIAFTLVATPIVLASRAIAVLKNPEENFGLSRTLQPAKVLVVKPIAMAIAAVANAILSPFVGLVSPKAMIRMHVDSQLTTFAKPSLPSTELPLQADDFVGMEELHEKFDNYLEILKNPADAKEFGIKFPAGMLLYGPPGCGKTYTVKHLCHYAKSKGIALNYCQIKGSDVASEWRGKTVLLMRAHFERAKQLAPTLLFIDECEGLFPSRNRFRHTYGAERTQELNEMLQLLEEAKEHNIIVVAATNHLESVDPAIFRTGRFDYSFEIKPPSSEARLKMFEAKLRSKKCSQNLNLQKLVEATEGFTASDIETIVNDAALLSWKRREPISLKLLMATLATVRGKKESVAQGPQDQPEQTPLMRDLKTGLDALKEFVGSIDRVNPLSATRE